MIMQRVDGWPRAGRRGLAVASLALAWALSPLAWADDPAPTSAPASQPAAGQRGTPRTDEERARLIEDIRARARKLAEVPAQEGDGESASKKASPRDKTVRVPAPRASGKPSVPPSLAAEKPGDFGPEPPSRPTVKGSQPAPNTQPAAGKGGSCGDAGQAEIAKLAPPPEDQPQPKLLVENPRIDLDVWRGEPAVFRFKLKNDGQAPLNILLKGG